MKWDYRMLVAQNTNLLLSQMQDLGKEGWELVSVTYDSEDEKYVAFLKKSLLA